MLDAFTFRRCYMIEKDPCMLRIIAKTMRYTGQPGYDGSANREIHADRQIKMHLPQRTCNGKHSQEACMYTAFIICEDMIYERIHRRNRRRKRHRQHCDLRLRPGLFHRPHRWRCQNHIANKGQINDKYFFWR